MSDVIVTTSEPVTTVTTIDNVVQIDVTESTVAVSASTAGIQGASYNQGDPIYVTVRNATGSTLPKGSIVYTSGANGTHTQVSLALATSDATSARCLGWLAESIANNTSGLCQVEGYLDGIDTQGVTQGAQLYLSGTTAGAFTATKPQAPIHLVYVGVSAKASAGNGRVYVKVQNGYELDEIHDVQITGLADGDVLEYDLATDLWKNRTLAQANIARLAGGNALTGAQTVTGTAIGDKVFVVKGASGQTANLTEWQDSAGTILGRVNNLGEIVTSTTVYANNIQNNTSFWSINNNGMANFTARSATNTPLTIKGAASQTAPLLEIRNSANTLLSYNLSNGDWVMPNLFNSYAGIGMGYSDYQGTVTSLYVRPTATTRSGAVIKGLTSQTANLLELQNDVGTILSRFTSTGQYQTSTVPAVGGLQSASGVGAYFAMNNDSGGIVTYTNGDANRGLIVRANSATQTSDLFQTQKSDGTLLVRLRPDTTNQTSDIANINGPLQISPTAGGTGYGLFVKPGASGVIGLLVRGLASQSGNLQEWQNSASAILASVDAFGQVRGTSSLFGLNSATNSVAITVRPVANQTADLVQYQNSSTTVLGGRNAVGQIYTGSTSPIITGTGGTIQSIATGANPLVTMATGHNLTTGDLVTLAGTTGGTYNGTFVVASTPSVGQFTITTALTTGQASAGGTVSDPAQASITARSSGTTGLILKGASFQSADLLQVQDSASTNLLVVTPTGTLRSAGLITAGSSTDVLGQLTVISTAASRIGAVIRGAVSQSANLQEWQTDTGTVRARIDSGGNFKAFNLASNNSALQIFESNSGGAVLFGKATAQASSPGAGFATMYFRDGTTAGTLKLVVRAGASGAETTILDNIPQ